MTNVSLHRFAVWPGRFWVALAWGLGLLTIGAIAPPPSPTQDRANPPLLMQTMAPLALTLETAAEIWETAPLQLPDLLLVTLYRPTATCEGYEGEIRAIAAEQALTRVVQTILIDQVPQLLNFDLRGYRLHRAASGHQLTIDFRRSAQAQRPFISLSICEQRALFGSLRKTLTANPVFEIDTVTFTERGQPIQL